MDIKANIFQVRFQGAKGMLVLNRQLDPNTIMLRKSMVKFNCPNKEACRYLDILSWNSYGAGTLNRQIITLLQANGLKTDKLLTVTN